MSRKHRLLAITIASMTMAVAGGDIIESFDGHGEFNDVNGRISGFDLEGWMVGSSDWESSGEKTLDGAFLINVAGRPAATAHAEYLRLAGIQWSGSFVQRIEVQDVSIFIPDSGRRETNLFFEHSFDAADPSEDRLIMCVCVGLLPLSLPTF